MLLVALPNEPIKAKAVIDALLRMAKIAERFRTTLNPDPLEIALFNAQQDELRREIKRRGIK